MKILAPVKRVVDANAKVRVKADGSGVEVASDLALQASSGHDIHLDAPLPGGRARVGDPGTQGVSVVDALNGA